FIDDGIEHSRLDALCLTPVLRKDMVNIDILTEEDGVIEFLPGTEVLGAFLHEKCIDALVGGGKAHSHGPKPVCPEHRFADRRWLRAARQPYRHFHKIAGNAGLYCRTVQLSEHAIPIPPDQLRSVCLMLPGIANLCENSRQGNNLRLIGKVEYAV